LFRFLAQRFGSLPHSIQQLNPFGFSLSQRAVLFALYISSKATISAAHNSNKGGASMNTNQNQKQSMQESKLNLALIPLEKAEQPSIWQRLKMAFVASDELDFQTWQKIESKRVRRNSSEQWRNN